MQARVFTCLFILFIIMTGSKCNHNKSITFCGVNNPVENIDWLRERVENAENIEVIKFTYNETEYLSINPCPGCPDNMTEIFDCKGNRFCTIGGITGRNTCPADFLEKSQQEVILKKGD